MITPEDIQKLATALTKRAVDARLVAYGYPAGSADFAQCKGKADAYRHAAELVLQELRRVS